MIQKFIEQLPKTFTRNQARQLYRRLFSRDSGFEALWSKLRNRKYIEKTTQIRKGFSQPYLWSRWLV